MALSNESPVTSVVPKYLGILDVVLQMEFATSSLISKLIFGQIYGLL